MNRKTENNWQFSNHLCQALSKSTQDYGLLFLPPRMPQVLSRSPAPMPQTDLLLWRKACYESALNKAFSSCQFYVDINANDYLKLICDRRCATMSFIYFLNVWVINLDRKGFWITESEWNIVHSPTHYVRWGQRGFKTFRPSVRQKGFCRIGTLLV